MGKTLIYPDEPVEELYSSSLMDEATRQNLIKYSRAIYELVCLGTHLLSWEFEADRGSDHEKLAVTAFFRRILQLLDAISIQIKEGAADTCEIHMRSLIETWLGFEFLLKEDTENRSLKYFLYEYNRKRKNFEKYTPEYNPGYNNLRQAYKNKGFLVKDIIPITDSAEKIARFEEAINNPLFDPFREDFNSKRDKHNLKWYHLGTDFQNLGLLAREVGQFELYDIAYQQYNNPTHGTDLMSGVFGSNDENISMMGIRDSTSSKDITMLAIQIGVLAFGRLAKRFTKEQQEEAHFRMGRYEVQHTRGVFVENVQKWFH
jgi:hypothetical protein